MKVASDVVGGVCALASELKAGLGPECEQTRIHVLEVPVLPMYDLPGNEGMREDAENINAALKSLRDPIQLRKKWLEKPLDIKFRFCDISQLPANI